MVRKQDSSEPKDKGARPGASKRPRVKKDSPEPKERGAKPARAKPSALQQPDSPEPKERGARPGASKRSEAQGHSPEHKEEGVQQPTAKRVKKIFSVMTSPNRIDILRILNYNGALTYSDLKALAGFRSKKESGKFAYHLRKMLKQSLVSLNKTERRYTVTNLGKLALSLARQLEERSVVESGKMYVRRLQGTIAEFDSYKIEQTLFREGAVPPELAQNITEEVEGRIYKYQATYLTGSMIRELINMVLVEHDHEEYRNRLIRVGVPIYDLRDMLAGQGAFDNCEEILLDAGKRVIAEHVMTNVLPRDVVDYHLSGDIHINNHGGWSMTPDILFVNLKDLLEDGLTLGGGYAGVSRIPAQGKVSGLACSLSVAISLLVREASEEVVLDGIIPLFAPHVKSLTALEQSLTNVFMMSSTAPKPAGSGVSVSVRLDLSLDRKMVLSVIGAYKRYVYATPAPTLALLIDGDAESLTDVSSLLAEIVSVGGRVVFGRGNVTSYGMALAADTDSDIISPVVRSVSINLPRLAFESNKDETYFRARLILLIKPVLTAMEVRIKSIKDSIKKGVCPVLAENMRNTTPSIVINLVGLREAVLKILKINESDGREVMRKVIKTTTEAADKEGRKIGCRVVLSTVDIGAACRFEELDNEKYGKHTVLEATGGERYSQGLAITSSELDSLDAKGGAVAECSFLDLLKGGMSIKLQIDSGMEAAGVKEAIEKMASMVPHFVPVMHASVCYECGHRGGPFGNKCPKCKSQHIREPTARP